jgi:NADPH-dependent 2,4-dienoyl-CoA reductase/sulfur reductase-like enzyme
MSRIVIVGASLAGVRAAESLRQGGFTGDITLVGAEPRMPYDRPPLSKKYLAGEWDADRTALRKPEVFAELSAEWLLGVPAASLDADTRTVTLDDGRTVQGDGVIVCTGATPRRLPAQPDLAGIHVLRALDDATLLRAELGEGKRFIVIGAGFIGLEAAATARQLGAEVDVLEGAPAPLIRGLGAEMGAAIAGVHRRHGVRVHTGVTVSAIAGEARVEAVEIVTAEGEEVTLPTDAVLVGIGVSPATEWLEGSGLELRDGVVCDAFLNAGRPGVYAAGDLLRWPNALFADLESDMRVEHWTNAAEQGAHAATNLLAELAGRERTPYSAVPFFWSDQFDARIQFIGRSTASSRVDVVAGDPAEGRWCAVYSDAGRVSGILGVTMPKLVMANRDLVAGRAPVSEAVARLAPPA